MDEKYMTELSMLIKKLNTDPEKGLSGREARARLSIERKKVRGMRSPFLSEKKEERRSIFGFLPSPVYLLVWIISLLSLIFAQSEVSAAVFVCCLVTLCVLGSLGTYSIILERRARLYSVPVVRVIRGGRVTYTDAKNIVCGDIIIFGEGDIIPADARLLMCRELSVSEYEKHDGRIVVRIAKKDTECDSGEGLYLSHTVYSGSPVMSGEGMAVVFATGSNIRAKKVLSEIIPPRKLPELASVKAVGDKLFRIELVSAAGVLLLSLIGLFTMRETTSAGIVLSALTPMLCLSPLIISALCRAVMLLSVYRTKKREFMIKSRRAIDLLPTVSDIVIFGRVGLTDGKKYIGREYLPASAYDEGARERLSEYIYTYLKALNSSEDGYFAEFSLDGYEEAVREYIRRYPCDTQRLDMTTRSLDFLNHAKDAEHLACADTNEGDIRICISLDRSCLEICKYQSEGEFASPLELETLTEELRQMDALALSPMFIMSDSGDGFVLEGVLGFSEKVTELSGLLERAEAGNKNIIAIINDENLQTLQYIERSGLSHTRPVARASEFSASGRSILEGIGEYCAYVGFSCEQAAQLLTCIKEKGQGILAYDVSEDYRELLPMCDISVSCDILEFEKGKYQNQVYERLPAEGRESSLRATSRLRSAVGVIVNRKNGLEAIFSARSTADAAHRNMSQYLLFSAQIFALIFGCILASVVSGVEILSAGGAMGIFVSFIVGAAFMFSQNVPRFTSIYGGGGAGAPHALILKKIPLLISLSASPMLCLLAVLIFRWTGLIPSLDGVDAISFLSLIPVGIFLAMQGSAQYCRKHFSDFLPRLLRVSVLPLALALIYLALPPIFNDLGFYKVSPLTLLLLPIFILVFLFAYGLGLLISEARRK